MFNWTCHSLLPALPWQSLFVQCFFFRKITGILRHGLGSLKNSPPQKTGEGDTIPLKSRKFSVRRGRAILHLKCLWRCLLRQPQGTRTPSSPSAGTVLTLQPRPASYRASLFVVNHWYSHMCPNTKTTHLVRFGRLWIRGQQGNRIVLLSFLPAKINTRNMQGYLYSRG